MFGKAFPVLIFLLVLVVASVQAPAISAQGRRVKAATEGRASAGLINPFVVGERLNYDVSWSDFIVAGELTLETRERTSLNGADAFHVVATAQSVGLVSAAVKKVNDVYESFIDASTLRPLRAQMHSRHGKNRAQSTVVIDQHAHTARLDNGATLDIPADTFDLAGLIYAVRGIDLSIGKGQTMTLLENGKLYPLRVEPEGREKITTRAGAYDTVRIATRSLGAAQSDPYKLRVYVTNDARRLPVMMTAEPSWGQVRVQLTSITGAKAGR